MKGNESWEHIFSDYAIEKHDFSKAPFPITAEQIKESTKHFTNTSDKEVRILCKQDSREDRPAIFQRHNIFILPVSNGKYNLIQGEGYIDIPDITSDIEEHKSILDFELESSKIGDSEMQHLDFAYASSVIRSFFKDPTLVLTIRGRKYTPKINFIAGEHKQNIHAESVQTEVDAGYEGKDKIVLVEAKNGKSTNVIIRQLFYPYKQWKEHTTKQVYTVFFENRIDVNYMWLFGFKDENNYNSIELINSKRIKVIK